MSNYYITRNPNPKPSDIASARRYTEIADAFEDMGEGVIWRLNGTIAAFHGRHLWLIENTPRLLALV